MNQLKVREERRGHHAHLTFFVRRLPSETWQNAGTIVVDQDQTALFLSAATEWEERSE